jgi:hypothetical protein
MYSSLRFVRDSASDLAFDADGERRVNRMDRGQDVREAVPGGVEVTAVAQVPDGLDMLGSPERAIARTQMLDSESHSTIPRNAAEHMKRARERFVNRSYNECQIGKAKAVPS